jgi:hypothetical protein
VYVGGVTATVHGKAIEAAGAVTLGAAIESGLRRIGAELGKGKERE